MSLSIKTCLQCWLLTFATVFGILFLYGFFGSVICYTEPSYFYATKVRLEKISQSIHAFQIDQKKLPKNLAELICESQQQNCVAYARSRDIVDSWNRPLYFSHDDARNQSFIWSLGSDGKVGGEKFARDLMLDLKWDELDAAIHSP